MTRGELVLRAINHDSSQGVPYNIPLADDAVEKYADRLLKDYHNPQAEEDLRKGLINKKQAVAFSTGNHICYITGPWWDWYGLDDEFLRGEDTPQVLPETTGTGNYEAFFSECRHIKQNYDAYRLLTVWGSHWEKAYFCRGIEHYLYDMAADPDWAQAVLDLIIRKNLVMLENMLPRAELQGVLLGSDWGTQRGLIMSPRMWHTMIEPGEKQEYGLLRKYGKHVWIHSCGCIADIMPSLYDMGVQVLNPVQPECMDIGFLKRKYGDRICFYGGISTQSVLPYGTPRDVIRETERTIRLMSENGGYITAPSQEIQADVPYGNLRALIDTARAYSPVKLN